MQSIGIFPFPSRSASSCDSLQVAFDCGHRTAAKSPAPVKHLTQGI